VRKFANKLEKIGYVLAVPIVSLCFCSPMSLAATALNDAIRTYDNGDYATALNLLSTLTSADLKGSALAHYYLARADLMNRHLEGARAEYALAYSLDKTGVVGKLCLDALKSIASDGGKRDEYAQTLTTLTDGVVGVTLGDGKIEFVVASGPAAKAGLKPGDEIVSVDSLPTKDLDDEGIRVLLRGAKGGSAKIQIKRADKPFTYDVVRDHVDVPEKKTSAANETKKTELAGAHDLPMNYQSFETLYANASEPVQLLMRAAALKAVANMQAGDLKEELMAKAQPLYKNALDLTNKNIAARPFDGSLYAVRAHIYDSSEEYQKAIDDYDFLAQLGMDNAAYLYAIARDKDGLKQYREAAEDYLRFARSQPDEKALPEPKRIKGLVSIVSSFESSSDRLSGYIGAAFDYLNLKETDKVIEVCTEGLAQSPEDPRLLLKRAEALSDKKDFEKALADCNIAFSGLQHKYIFGVPLDTEVGAYELRAKIYRGLGRDRDASMDEQTAKIISSKDKEKDK
jgi:tetratricopeptide (TPR) repeat protein